MVDHVIRGDLVLGVALEEGVLFALCVEHFCRGGVKGDGDLLAGFIACGFDGVENDFAGFFV